MALAQLPLPTAWLAPPDGLLPSNHATKIEPVPIAISATVAVVISAVVFILFHRKGKEVFLEDRIQDAADDKTPAAVEGHSANNNDMTTIIESPRYQHLLPAQPAPVAGQPNANNHPKLDVMLGFQYHWNPEHEQKIPQPPLTHQTHFAPVLRRNEYGSDIDPLKDDEKNSAIVPYPRSEASDDSHGGGQGARERSDRLQVFDGESMVRRSPLSLASKSRLGDAY